MRYVRDTTAGKSITAKIILNKKGEYVATVQAHYANSGGVLVNVFQNSKAAERCAKVTGKEWPSDKADDMFGFQAGHAGGYGYDKFAAALSRLWIDGHQMGNHCGRDGAPKPPRGHKLYPRDYKAPKGYRLANFVSETLSFGFNPEQTPNPRYQGEEGYQDCYRLEGLKFLEDIGYRIFEAI